MIVWLVSCLALASAAPYYNHHYDHHEHPHFPPPQRHHPHPDEWSDDYFGGEMFDTRRFWQDLATEMHRFDQMLNQFTQHFPSSATTEVLEGNEYKLTINLPGFDEKDIVVKAKDGLLMIQALHKTEEGNERSYLDLRTLPSYVNVSGNWLYEKGVLKIVFPVTEKPKEVTEAPVIVTTHAVDIDVDTETQTEAEDKSREEMGGNTDNVKQDADVGLNRGDSDSAKETEILTNYIPKDETEATTYAVDLKGEVEFVPVKY